MSTKTAKIIIGALFALGLIGGLTFINGILAFLLFMTATFFIVTYVLDRVETASEPVYERSYAPRQYR